MKVLHTIFNRVFTVEFYRLNALFFLLSIGLAFGFMSGREHMALAEFIIGSPLLTLVPFAVWVLYGIKIYSFNKQVCQAREISFVHSVSLLPRHTQIAVSLSVIINQFMPALLYGMFLISMALHHTLPYAALSLTISLILPLAGLTFFLHQQMQFPQLERKTYFLKKWMDRTFEKPFTQFFAEWLCRKQPGLFIITKLFSAILLFAISQLYRYDEYDNRLMAMGCVLGFAANLAIVYQYVLFENHILSLLRNLPLPWTRRMLLFLSAMLVLNLPELLVLTRTFPDALGYYNLFEMMVSSFILLMGGYSYLLRKNITFESFTGHIFIFSFVVLIAILYKVPLLLLSGLALGASLYVYPKYFYNFEITIDTPGK